VTSLATATQESLGEVTHRITYTLIWLASRDPEAAWPNILAIQRGSKDLQRGRHPGEASFPCREDPTEHVGVKLLHGTAGPDHAKGRIETQEGLKQILFAPETEILHDEFFRIVKRSEDIVKVDEHARSQLEQNAETFVENIAVD